MVEVDEIISDESSKDDVQSRHMVRPTIITNSNAHHKISSNQIPSSSGEAETNVGGSIKNQNEEEANSNSSPGMRNLIINRIKKEFKTGESSNKMEIGYGSVFLI